MNRREIIGGGIGISVAIFSAAAAMQALPRRDRIRVAFMVGKRANVMDIAGPWEVFQDVTLDNGADPFELYTVGPTHDVLTLTGGLLVKPTYTIENAPQPNIIVVGATGATGAQIEWLRETSKATDVTMSVCTGAFKLAQAGLLKGIPTTTHHDYWDELAREYPDVEVRRGPRFVDNGRIASAGGLTSGIDLALHIVQRYYGEEVAARTARYLEHNSEAWKT